MAWLSGPDTLYARRSMGHCGNTLTTGFLCGGIGDVPKDWSESFNGTAWFSEDAIIYAREGLAAVGDSAAALCFGGVNSSGAELAYTELYDGDSWSEVNALNNYRNHPAGAGDSNDALCMGGVNSAGTKLDTTEKWNGTTWSSDADINAAKDQLRGGGDIDGAVVCGGRTGTPAIYVTEIYNGTVWSVGNNLNVARRVHSFIGDENNALAVCGINSAGANIASCEKWNGTTWSSVANLSVARHGVGGFGNISGAGAASGRTDVDVKTTEIWYNSRLIGVVVDKTGTTITSVTCNVDIYDTSSRGTRIATAVSSADNGVWITNSVAKAVDEKVLAMFTYEGTYKGDTDIAGAEFITTTSAQ